MPYPTLASLPDAVKALPKHAQEIFQSAFNAAFKQYEGDEAKSAATAWAAVKTKYEKKDDKWVAKEAVHPHGAHVCVCPECGKEITVEENVKCNTQSCPECKVRMRAKDIGERRESMIGELQSKYSEIIQEAGRRNANIDSSRLKKIMALCQELLSSDEVDDGKVKRAVKEANTALAWLKEQAVVKTEDDIAFPAEAYAYVPDSEKSSTWKLRMWEEEPWSDLRK